MIYRLMPLSVIRIVPSACRYSTSNISETVQDRELQCYKLQYNLHTYIMLIILFLVSHFNFFCLFRVVD